MKKLSKFICVYVGSMFGSSIANNTLEFMQK